MATSDDIARRIAERLAPTTDRSLPAQVDHALAEGDDEDEGPLRSVPPAVVAGLASFVVSVAELTWSIFKDERDRAERRAAEAKPAAPVAAAVEVAPLKGLIDGRLATTVDVPKMLPPEVRVAVVGAAAEEAVAAGRRNPDRWAAMA